MDDEIGRRMTSPIPGRQVRSLLDDVGGVDRNELVAASRRRRFRRSEVIFHEGDPGSSLHLIQKGHVAIRANGPMGDVVTLTVLGRGEVFGELALLRPESNRSASAVALGPTETLSWSQAKLEDLRSRSAEVDRFLLEVLATQVTRLTGHLVEALHLSVETRVLRRLVALAALYDDEDGAIRIPVTQEDLASMAGTTRPTANRVLREAEGSRLLRLGRGQITVTDLPRLVTEARIT